MKIACVVVSYRNSTSNHNSGDGYPVATQVVSYRNSTSNHNSPASGCLFRVLYLIEILHQTTTLGEQQRERVSLYLIEILHQTTTQSTVSRNDAALYLIEILHQTTTKDLLGAGGSRCILSKFYIKPQQALRKTGMPQSCILSKFYIKPQLLTSGLGTPLVVSYRNSTSNHNLVDVVEYAFIVVSYRNSTSNHNLLPCLVFCPGLYLIEILHQTTTLPGDYVTSTGCILSKFYIKPQRLSHLLCLSVVVSYRNSTSNHNFYAVGMQRQGVVSYRNSTSNHNTRHGRIYANSLYLIEILHQTTTSGLILIDKVLLTGCLPL